MVDAPGRFDLDVVIDREQRVEALLLPFGEQAGTGVQGSPQSAQLGGSVAGAGPVGLLPAPERTSVLGIDETRARSMRWIRDEADSRWPHTNPWMTSMVNADPAGPGTLLGLSWGRSGASVRDWLDLQSEQFKVSRSW